MFCVICVPTFFPFTDRYACVSSDYFALHHGMCHVVAAVHFLFSDRKKQRDANGGDHGEMFDTHSYYDKKR